MQDELTRISERYDRRKNITNIKNRYSRFETEVILRTQERQRALVDLFKRQGINDLSEVSVLEIGCGNGSNLLELLLFGADPSKIVGNELLPERMKQARNSLPEGIKLFSGDAANLPFESSTFEVVYQSTMFSSILDDTLQERISARMWDWLKPGGFILWYDFIYNNPTNSDVRGVKLNRIKELFPDAKIDRWRVTLAPPLSRRLIKIHPCLYGCLDFPHYGRHRYSLIKHSGGNDGKGTICGRV